MSIHGIQSKHSFYQKLYFCTGTLTTNHWPLAVLVVCPLGAVNQQFYVGPDHFIIQDVLFLSVFWWIYCNNKHVKCFGHFRPSSGEESKHFSHFRPYSGKELSNRANIQETAEWTYFHLNPTRKSNAIAAQQALLELRRSCQVSDRIVNSSSSSISQRYNT